MNWWIEVSKLVVTAIITLSAIYIRVWVVKRNELKYAKKNLKKILTEEMVDNNNAYSKFGQLLYSLKHKNKVVYINLKIPAILIECLKIMSKLDCKNATEYYNYQAFIEIVLDDHRNLVILLNQAASINNIKNKIPENMINAVESQVYSLKENLKAKLEFEKKLMDILIND